MNFFRSLGLSARFMLLIGILVLISAFSSRMFYTRQGRTNSELRLREKAVFLQKVYSSQIGSSLLKKDDVTLLQDVNRLEEDQEITSIVVVDKRNLIRYHSDPQKMGTVNEDESIKKTLDTGEGVMQPIKNSGGRALAILAPLQIQGSSQPFGAMRIDLTYLYIEKQLAASAERFWFMILGSVSLSTTIALVFLNRWILIILVTKNIVSVDV